MEKGTENTRVTLIGIIVEDPEAAIRINGLLHEYGEYIIGRMGIPYHEKQMNIISVVMDAPQEKVSALSGKLGICLLYTSWLSGSGICGQGEFREGLPRPGRKKGLSGM